MGWFHEHTFTETTRNFRPPYDGGVEVSARGRAALEFMYGVTTIIRSCPCGEERRTEVIGDAR